MSAREEALIRLQMAHEATRKLHIRDLFAQDSSRFEKFSAQFGDILLDYSKCRVEDDIICRLGNLLDAVDVAGRRDAMFSGSRINVTENRPVLHVALRNLGGRSIYVDGHDVMPSVVSVLDQMEALAIGVRSGRIRSSTGQPFSDVVNIGIGGSDLGPAMVTAALAPYHDGPRIHFVSNVDGAHIADTLAKLKPETTLFIIASKSFTTVETMTNANTARQWLVSHSGVDAVHDHFCALSTAMDKVIAFGISPERTFGFWDWVGGRYSVWSAIGLSVLLAVGPAHFRAFLDGAHALDENFRTAPYRENLAMLLGALGYWHRAICGYPARAVLPYDQRLARFPAHLQQLDMESNGKSVSYSGQALAGPSGPIVFGEPGTNGQHAFYQLLHQGTDIIPCEFLIAGEGHEADLAHQHRLLVANCLAQSEALAFGRLQSDVEAELRGHGLAPQEIVRLAPHKTFAGDRPSITIAYKKLDPATLGKLLALYEHRVFVESVLYDVNAFDQWGVELGKTLAGHIGQAMLDTTLALAMNSSTSGLIAHLSGRRRNS